ncbi:hypothetical protein G6F57_008068 [Rhizopus arrhizus]|uniref:Transmembrane protein 198 n=1 Tax=Rhizopus oryzae TaxID=64495 RepID=A0A9P6X777_RHIOR|nr:hypothetical protein G6F23_007884 [Rhizopus arrhizus]KAG1420067.1 hypothetical protein G6F58_004338 [Rhizopus delemar]KAG0764062.1 hypothetical protein G6F24_005523 [Rhizopus arrhizus]KAG0788728.1 hypothetical protein G6F22_006919 [Rhizopus arrhizus]KAG0795922.1 hypothetical protein G6F21_001719 [Rhizopus arrhizus]
MQFKHLCLFSFFLLSVLAASIDRHKRDVVDLHHSGGTKTTTTAMTARPTTQPTASPYPAASSDPAIIYGGNHITPENGVMAGILIVLGLYLIVFGFRSFRLTLAVGGFVTFGLITWVAMTNNQPYQGYMNNNITMIAVPAGLGLLGAILYALFWSISIYLMGAVGGLALALYILCCKENLVISQVPARAALLVALPVFFSFITFFVERYVLLFSFAFLGSYLFMVGVDLLAHTGYLAGLKSVLDGNGYHRVIYIIQSKTLAIIIMIPILWLFSFVWQYMYNKDMKFGVIFEPRTVVIEEKITESAPPPPAEPAPVVVEHTVKETTSHS